MITASITETRRRLGALIELARRGEDVIIVRDSRPVAAIQSIDPSDLPVTPRLTDRQARRLWRMIEAGPKVTFASAAAAARFLKGDVKRKR